MRDTSEAAERRYFQLLGAQSPMQRLETAVGLTEAVRALAEAAIRARHPDASEIEVRAALAARLYGAEAARKLFPTVPTRRSMWTP